MTARDLPPAPPLGNAPRLERETFTTSRLAEFTSVAALTAATGHPPVEWALVILKELTDNGIDNAELNGIAPVIAITVDADGITVTDNGGGIEPEVVARILDYNNRTSSTEAIVSPTRGRQGNALQTIFAIPYALDGKRGETVIESRGVKHVIIFETDPVRRIPAITHTQTPTRRFVHSGTRITVRLAGLELDAMRPRFVQMANDYGTLNPHLTLTLTWHGDKVVDERVANPAWQKWMPSNPLVAHWYDGKSFDNLIGNVITHHGRETLVRPFIARFKGMTRSDAQSAVLDEMDAHRMPLATLFETGKQRALLTALKEATKPVKPADLGAIGRATLEDACDTYGGDPDSFKYHKVEGATDGVPWLLEAAFAWCPGDDAPGCALITGCNWSPGFGDLFDLNAVFEHQRVYDSEEPVTVIIHLVYPAATFTGRGKSELALPVEIEEAVNDGVTKVTAAWAKQRRAEERDKSAQSRRAERLARRQQVSAAAAAREVIEKAYLAASADGTLPANARQIMYAARPYIQEKTGGKQLRSSYFTQQLLIDFINDNPKLTASWKIAFDDRGHLTEPHTNHEIGLGTLAVDEYLDDCKEPVIVEAALKDAHVATLGPAGRFRGLLYIEKEGFMPLLEHVQLAERFDIAIMSSKGMQVTAARKLAEAICHRYKIPLYVLHDFDKAGMSIAALFQRNNRRYTFTEQFEVTDLGFRLDDVRDESLLGFAEAVFDRGEDEAKRANLRLNGATEEEVEFLLDQRVELNALPSDRFVEYVERKLTEHGARKIIPNKKLLQETYRAILRTDRARPLVEKVIADLAKGPAIAVPADLPKQVADFLEESPEFAWDAAVAKIARGEE